MEAQIKHQSINSDKISELLLTNFSTLMSQFYEMQSLFLSKRYKLHQSLESSCILTNLIKTTHLKIMRQREKNLDHDISLNNFFNNLHNVQNDPSLYDKSETKIITIVNSTGVPKETVRRKLKILEKENFIKISKNKEYFWNIDEANKDKFMKITKSDISEIAKFVAVVSKFLNMPLEQKEIEKEIEKQFSFYFYHFLNCQLNWMCMWRNKIKDIDLVLIALQALIPTLQFADKNIKIQGLENTYKYIGHTSELIKLKMISVSAASISEITGIPRATCIRKLEKLVLLGVLIREEKSKRYYINRQVSARTKNIMTKENIDFTIRNYSNYISIMINAITRNLAYN